MSKPKIVWHTERRKIKDLVLYDKNPRTLSAEQLEGLKRSLKKFDVAELPCVNTDNTLIAGNQRVMVLALLGRNNEEIEVRLPNRKLSKAEFRDYLLTSNRSGASWDYSMLASEFNIDELLTAGFDSMDLTNIFDDSIEILDDEFDEEKATKEATNTDIQAGDYFALGRHRLLCSDATSKENVLKLMGKTKAHFINTDNPYNLGMDYSGGISQKQNYGGTTNDKKSDIEFESFLRALMQNALSVAHKDAHIMFWCSDDYVWLFQKLYRELGINFKRLNIWIKNNCASPTPKIAFNRITEYAVYGTVGKPWMNEKIKNLNEVMNKEVGSGNRLIDDILDLLNIWLVHRLPSSEYRHPTTKPPSLHEKALRRCTKPGDIVLDLTAGSGSILSACEQLNRTAYMCEIEPVFCQVIINRFNELSHVQAKKLN